MAMTQEEHDALLENLIKEYHEKASDSKSRKANDTSDRC